ncbi:MAG: hypothetical protein N4A40_12920 [Tissierellales bacterium]|jgi:Flp pilus assembly protein TadB|nr:hypothetical protein [Tissierellales bacterium]
MEEISLEKYEEVVKNIKKSMDQYNITATSEDKYHIKLTEYELLKIEKELSVEKLNSLQGSLITFIFGFAIAIITIMATGVNIEMWLLFVVVCGLLIINSIFEYLLKKENHFLLDYESKIRIMKIFKEKIIEE